MSIKIKKERVVIKMDKKGRNTMSTEKWFSEVLETFENDFDFRLEGIIFELTEQICKRMKGRDINRKKLAETLNVSPAAVSKILNGNSNFTIRTLLSLADALKTELKIEFKENSTNVIDSAGYTKAAQVKVVAVGERQNSLDTTDVLNLEAWMIVDIKNNLTSTSSI
jgi:transcriptional regulator with XRE-family HTH domain